MHLLTWRILSLISIIIFLVLLILLLILKPLKNHYLFPYVEDELFNKKKLDGYKQEIYVVTSSNKKYIDKYLINIEPLRKTLIVSYVQPYSKIRFYVMEYDKNKKVIGVLRIMEVKTNSSSNIILLDKKTKYVNIIVGKVDSLEVNFNIMRPMKNSSIRFYSISNGLIFFNFFFFFRHLCCEILSKQYIVYFLNSWIDYLIIGILFFFGLLIYLTNLSTLKKRNKILKEGGRLSYEFI